MNLIDDLSRGSISTFIPYTVVINREISHRAQNHFFVTGLKHAYFFCKLWLFKYGGL